MLTPLKILYKMPLVWGSTHCVPSSVYVPFDVLANIFPPESTGGIQILMSFFFPPTRILLFSVHFELDTGVEIQHFLLT